MNDTELKTPKQLQTLQLLKRQIECAIDLVERGELKSMTPPELEEHVNRFGEDSFVIGDFVIKRRKAMSYPTRRIIRRPIVWSIEHWHCECGGEMIATGATLMTCPPKFEHKCEKCGRLENDKTEYPAKTWRYADEPTTD